MVDEVSRGLDHAASTTRRVEAAPFAGEGVIDRSMLGLGCIGKSGAFLIAVGLWLAHEASILVVVAAIGDLVFAALWLAWLRSSASSLSGRQH